MHKTMPFLSDVVFLAWFFLFFFTNWNLLFGENVKQWMHMWPEGCWLVALLSGHGVATCCTRRIGHGSSPPSAAKGARERNQLNAFPRSGADTNLDYFVHFAYCSLQFIALGRASEFTSPEYWNWATRYKPASLWVSSYRAARRLSCCKLNHPATRQLKRCTAGQP